MDARPLSRDGRKLSRRQALRLAGLAGAGLFSAPLLAACGGGAAPPPSTAATTSAASSAASSAPQTSASAGSSVSDGARKQLVVAQSGDIFSLDPHLSTNQINITVTFNLYDNLTSRHADLKLYPSLATEWKTLNDTTWEFKLRKGVKFHNGDPFTSKDVKFSIERTYDPAARTLVATVFTTVDKSETPDDYTVHFITKKPNPLLADRLAFYGGQMIPVDYFKKVGADEFNRKPVGTGVIKFVSWVKDDKVIFARNDDYWGDKVPFETVTFRPLPETAARLAAFTKGEVDMITRVPPDQVAQVDKSGHGKTSSVRYAGLYAMYVNSKVQPLDNKLVKQAMSLAVDRASLVKDVYNGQGSIPSSYILEEDSPTIPRCRRCPSTRQRQRTCSNKVATRASRSSPRLPLCWLTKSSSARLLPACGGTWASTSGRS